MSDLASADNRFLPSGDSRAEMLDEPSQLSGVLVVVAALIKNSRIIHTETGDYLTGTLRDRSRKKNAPHDRS